MPELDVLCDDYFAHYGYGWTYDVDGTAHCTIDHPIRRGEIPALYWSFVGGVWWQFDDATRVVTIYTEEGTVDEERPYTDQENTRADAGIADASNAAADAAHAAQVDALLQSSLVLSEANAPADGSPWVQPTGSTDAYPKGALVTHNGKSWESTVDFNVWEPGVANWREHVISGCPTWVQPTGASDDYNTGDCVSFEGACYQSLIDANVWSPTAYPAGWEEIVCP